MTQTPPDFFVYKAADPLDVDKVLIWGSRSMGRRLLRVSCERWDRYLREPESDEALSRLGCAEAEGAETSAKLRRKFLRDRTNTFSQIIMPSADCPHGCGLQSFGNYCGQIHRKQQLAEHRIVGLEADLSKALSASYSKYMVGFFGAEPLTNWKFVVAYMQRAVELATNQEKRHLITGEIVTSGMLLTAKVHKQLRDAGIDLFEVTIDGPRQIHDARRPTRDGRGSFDDILRNLEAIKNNSDSGNFVIRVNVDVRNEHSVFDLIQELEDREILGWAGLYIAPIRDWGSSRAGSTVGDPRRFAQLELKVFSRLFRRGLRPELLPDEKKRTCVALANEPSVIAPNGERYRCTEVPLSEQPNGDGREWGDVDLPAWQSGIIAGKFPCAQCSLLPVCGGSCPKDWLKGNSPCPPLKWNVKGRMQLLAVFEPDLVEDI